MQQHRPLIIGSALLVIGCGGLPSRPEKPVIEMGFLDLPRGEVITRTPRTAAGAATRARAPLSDYDKATCFRLADWSKVQNYISELEASSSGPAAKE